MREVPHCWGFCPSEMTARKRNTTVNEHNSGSGNVLVAFQEDRSEEFCIRWRCIEKLRYYSVLSGNGIRRITTEITLPSRSRDRRNKGLFTKFRRLFKKGNLNFFPWLSTVMESPTCVWLLIRNTTVFENENRMEFSLTETINKMSRTPRLTR